MKQLSENMYKKRASRVGSPLLLTVQLFTQYLHKPLVYSLEEVLGVDLLLVFKR